MDSSSKGTQKSFFSGSYDLQIKGSWFAVVTISNFLVAGLNPYSTQIKTKSQHPGLQLDHGEKRRVQRPCQAVEKFRRPKIDPRQWPITFRNWKKHNHGDLANDIEISSLIPSPKENKNRN